MEGVKLDQTFAEILCMVNDCCNDVLRSGKQINKAIIFGISINYSVAKVTVYKMILDFTEDSF